MLGFDCKVAAPAQKHRNLPKTHCLHIMHLNDPRIQAATAALRAGNKNDDKDDGGADAMDPVPISSERLFLHAWYDNCSRPLDQSRCENSFTGSFVGMKSRRLIVLFAARPPPAVAACLWR